MDVLLCDELLNSSKFQGVFLNTWNECKAMAVEGRNTFNVYLQLYSLSCIITTVKFSFRGFFGKREIPDNLWTTQKVKQNLLLFLKVFPESLKSQQNVPSSIS